MDDLREQFRLWVYTQKVQDIMPVDMNHYERLMHFGELAFKQGFKFASQEPKKFVGMPIVLNSGVKEDEWKLIQINS